MGCFFAISLGLRKGADSSLSRGARLGCWFLGLVFPSMSLGLRLACSGEDEEEGEVGGIATRPEAGLRGCNGDVGNIPTT